MTNLPLQTEEYSPPFEGAFLLPSKKAPPLLTGLSLLDFSRYPFSKLPDAIANILELILHFGD